MDAEVHMVEGFAREQNRPLPDAQQPDPTLQPAPYSSLVRVAGQLHHVPDVALDNLWLRA